MPKKTAGAKQSKGEILTTPRAAPGSLKGQGDGQAPLPGSPACTLFHPTACGAIRLLYPRTEHLRASPPCPDSGEPGCPSNHKQLGKPGKPTAEIQSHGQDTPPQGTQLVPPPSPPDHRYVWIYSPMSRQQAGRCATHSPVVSGSVLPREPGRHMDPGMLTQHHLHPGPAQQEGSPNHTELQRLPPLNHDLLAHCPRSRLRQGQVYFKSCL